MVNIVSDCHTKTTPLCTCSTVHVHALKLKSKCTFTITTCTITNLFKELAWLATSSFNTKFSTEYITQFSTISIPPSSHFSLLIIVVRWGQQGTKYHLRYVHFFNSMHLHWYTQSIIPYTNQVVLTEKLNKCKNKDMPPSWCVNNYMYMCTCTCILGFYLLLHVHLDIVHNNDKVSGWLIQLQKMSWFVVKYKVHVHITHLL